MPRHARRSAPGSVQHVIARFVNREFLFDLQGARDEYVRRVATVMARTDWRPIAFALMSSHVHWVLQAGEQPSASFVKPLHSGFAGWLNRTHRRLGPAFAERHRTIEFAGDTAAALLAYVHNNPVRAGVAKEPASSPWTSHRAYLALEAAPAWLDVERGLALAGFSPTRAGRSAFHAFVRGRCGEERCSKMSGRGLGRQRARARSEAQAPVEIGTPLVRLRGRQRIMVVPAIVPAGCPTPCDRERAIAAVLGAVSRGIEIPVATICSRSRARSAVAARRLAMLIWVRHLERPAVQMARALGIAASTASELVAGASRQAQQLALQIARSVVVPRGPHGGDDGPPR